MVLHGSCTYAGKGASIVPSREGIAVDAVPQRTLLASKDVRMLAREFPGFVVRTSCANCRARSSSSIGATAAAGLNHGAMGRPLQ